MLIKYLTEIFLILFVVLTLCFYVWFLITKWQFIKFAYCQNGFFLPIIPKIGTMYVPLFARIKFNSFSIIDWSARNLKFPFSLWVGHDYNYFPDDAEEIATILTHKDCYGKAGFYDNFRVFFKDTILTVPYEIWQPRRQHLVQSFKPNMIKSYFTTFSNQSLELIEEMKKSPNAEDLFHLFGQYTYINFFLTHAGLDEVSVFSNMKRLAFLLGGIQAEFGRIILDPIIAIRLYFKWFNQGISVFSKLKEAKTYVMGLISKKRKQSENGLVHRENNQICLVDLLLNYSNKMFTDQQVTQELGLFQAAATETTGSSLTFCCVLLAMHPKVQERLYQEIKEVIGDFSLTEKNIEELPYMQAVINESMRIFPVISLIGRRCGADINVGSKIIPKGTNVMISIYHLHKNEKYWTNPTQFDPSRFLPPNNINKKAFIPFSYGGRNCIGMKQALILMKITMVNLIRNFEIKTNHKSLSEFELQSCVSVTTANPIYCQFIPRNQN